jgi:hypothetical protein
MRFNRLESTRRTALLFLLPALCLAVTQASATEADAKKILKSMSDYLASQTSFSLTFDSSVEVITPAMEKIQFTSSGDLTMARPSSVHASRKGGYADVEMFFDGKTFTIYGKNLNGYAQIEEDGTVDQLIDTLRDRGIAVPGADLLLSNVYDTLMGEVIEAKVIGEGVVEGVECDHLAFRSQETDWQLWIENGDSPIPRKYVITTKAVGGAPQYTLVIKDWQSDVSTTAATFTFEAPQGAQVLAADALDTLNDVPPPAPTEGQ